MLNQNPIWKYVLVIFVLAVCTLYALPNLYGEDHAVQISSGKNSIVSEQMIPTVEASLQESNIEFKAVEFKDDKLLVRLNDSDTQLVAREYLDDTFGQNYLVAMNLAPDTPDWLEALNAAPMKLGLDLRGGIHFLMEVDMKSAVSKAFEDSIDDFQTQLREQNLRYRSVRQVGDFIEITFRDPEILEDAQFFLRNNYGNMMFSERDELTLRASFTEGRLAEIKEYAVKQNITIIRSRVNQLGVDEPLVQKQGADRIVV